MNTASKACHRLWSMILPALVMVGPVAIAEETMVCLTIEEAVSLSGAIDPAIAEAEARQQGAIADRSEIIARGRPSISAYGRASDGGIGLVDGRSNTQIGVIVSQRLIDFGKGGLQREAANARVSSSEYSVSTARNQSSATAARAYLALEEAAQRLEIARKRERSYEEIAASGETRLELRAITLADASSIQAELATAKVATIEAEMRVDAASLQLVTWTGSSKGPCEIERLSDVTLRARLPLDLEAALQEAGRENSDLREAREEARANEFELRETGRRWLPTVDAQAVGAMVYDNVTNSWETSDRIGIELSTTPLFWWFALCCPEQSFSTS